MRRVRTKHHIAGGWATPAVAACAYALIALAASPADPAPSSTVPTAKQVLSLDQAAVTRIRERFCTSVTAHFPGVQATRIITLFTDFERLRALPCNEVVSLTVRN